jgi:predicted DNA binding protein
LGPQLNPGRRRTQVLEAVLKVEAPDDWRRELIEKYDAEIHMLDCHEREEGGCKNLVDIKVGDEQLPSVLKDMEANPTVSDLDLDQTGPGHLRGAVTSNVCLGCCTLVSSETFLVGVRMDERGDIHQRIITKDRETVRHAISRLEALGHGVTLEKLTTLEPDMYMTGYQEDVLMIAYERGYFDSPRRTDLREMAALFGVSVATMSEIIRKAQRKVLAEHFP